MLRMAVNMAEERDFDTVFPITLSLCGVLKRPAAPEGASATDRLAPEAAEGVEDGRLTWCDWTRRGTSPAAFDALEAEHEQVEAELKRHQREHSGGGDRDDREVTPQVWVRPR